MPKRPLNIAGKDPKANLAALNQSVRETQIALDKVKEQIPVQQLLKTSAVLNFGTIPANTAIHRSVPMIGTTQQAAVHVSPQLNVGNSNLVWSSQPGSVGQITIILLNPTAAPITPNVVRWNVAAIL